MTTFEVAQQLPEWGFFNRAFLLRDFAHVQSVFAGPVGAQYRKDVAEKMGIEILSVAYLGTRQVALRSTRPVAGPEDLKGLKLRMPAGPEWLLLGQSLGVSPVPMGMPEVYLALKTGAIDGQENPLSIFSAAKLYEVSEQVVLTSHLVQPVFFAIAKPFFDKLTPAQQQSVRTAALNAAKANNDARLADEASIATAMKARGLAVDAIDLARFRAQADHVYASADMAKSWNKTLMQQVIDTK
jgi:TRAP-type C4-dicarboxylate transport system substrate-binding protein